MALRPSLHWDYEPQLLEMSTPKTPWDTLLNLVLANAQEPFAYKLKSHTSTEECYCQPATHTTLLWNLSTAFQIIWELRAGCLCPQISLPCTEGATLAQQAHDASTENHRLPTALGKHVPDMSLKFLLLFTLCEEQTFSMTLHTKG